MTRRRTIAAAGGTLVAAGAAVGVVVLAGGGDDARAGAAEATVATKLATITRRDLVETDSEDGTLGYTDARRVVNRLSGTLTWLPRTGSVVRPGRRLYAVDGEAVYLMDGGAPAYRALTPSTSDGADVRQLERNLRRLGYDPSGAMTVDGSWDAGTTAAVERWQDAHDMDVTGSIPLGRVVFQPGARRIASIDMTLGGSAASGSGQADTNGGGAAGVVSGLAAGLLHAMQTGVPTPTTTTTTTTTATTPPPVTTTVTVTTPAPRPTATRPAATRPATTTTAAAGPTAALRSAGGGGGGGGSAAPSGSGSGAAASSGGATAASPILTTTSTRQVVAVQLDAAKQSVARDGARVGVELPDGNRVSGRIARVGRTATAATSSQAEQSGAASTLKVTVKLTRHVAALDQAPVTVDFEQSRARDVLTIPVTALLARPGGTFGVEVRDGSGRRVVPVTTGLYASGFVEIEGDVREGQRVSNAGI